MRKLTNFTLLICLSLITSGILMSGFALAGVNQWTSIGLEGAEIRALSIDPFAPATIYAGTRRLGIFKSTDGGESWADINNGLSYAYSSTILLIDPVTPTTIYSGASVLSGGFKSTDGGDSWNATWTDLPDDQVVILAIDAVDPDILYASSFTDAEITGQPLGFAKSTDGGESWTAINDGLTYIVGTALVIDPLDPTVLYGATRRWVPSWGMSFPGSVSKSTDGGASWFPIDDDLPGHRVHILAIDPFTPTTLYASIVGYGLSWFYKTTDGGESWFDITEGLTFITENGEIGNSTVMALVINPTTPDTLYAGTDGQGVLKSTDGGESWTAINSGLANLSIHALAIDPINPTTIYTGVDGVYSYDDLDSDSSDVLDSSDSSDSSDFF